MVLVGCSEDNLSGSAADGRSWVRYFGGDGEEYGVGVAVSPSGDVYVTGYDVIDYHWHSQLLIKYDAHGALQWERQVNSEVERLYAWGRSVCCLGSDTILVAGEIATTGSLNYYMAGFTANGDTVLSQEIANPRRDDFLLDFCVNSDLGLTMVGNSTQTGFFHILVIKMDLDGGVVWRRAFGGLVETPKYDMRAFGVVSMANGDIVIAGSRALIRGGVMYGPQALIFCLDPSGSRKWEHACSGTLDSAVASGVIALADGTLAYCYNSRDTLTGYWDTHVRVLDSDGNELWGMDMPTANRSDYATTILERSPGVFWLFGWTIDHGVHMPLMVQVNRNTNEWWVKSLTEPPPPSGATDAVLHPDGGVVMTGTCVSYSGGVQMWVRRF